VKQFLKIKAPAKIAESFFRDETRNSGFLENLGFRITILLSAISEIIVSPCLQEFCKNRPEYCQILNFSQA